MVRLTMISGPGAGQCFLATRYPLTIGRDRSCGWVIEAAGVWARHATLLPPTSQGFMLRAEGDGLLSVNGVPTAEARLRSGDAVDLGAARIRFQLSEMQPRSYRFREVATWVSIGLLSLGQVLMIYLLLP